MARRSIAIRCSCCHLVRKAWDIDGEPRPTICGLCYEHRGVNLSERRATEHEQILREALYAADKSARDAYEQRDSYKVRMHAAYRGRERALRYLDQVAAMHALRSDGACSCGLKSGCRVGALVAEPWVQRELTKLEERDREQASELGHADGPSRDDEWLVREWDRLDGTDGASRSTLGPGRPARRRPA